MHVRACEEKRIRVPFVVGDDFSRTWVFSKTNIGCSYSMIIATGMEVQTVLPFMADILQTADQVEHNTFLQMNKQ